MNANVTARPYIWLTNFVIAAISFWAWHWITGAATTFGSGLAFGALFLGTQLASLLVALLIGLLLLLVIHKLQKKGE